MRGWRAFSTRWCAPMSSAPTSTIASPTRFVSSTRVSASICGRRTEAAGEMADPVAWAGVSVDPAGYVVSLRDVTKAYDNGVMALGPIDIEVRRGEFVSLLGPSGCGKSTALRLIAGLSAPTSGTVHVARPEVTSNGGHPIGFVFQ